MEVWFRILIKIVAGVMSIIDASNLRNRLFETKEEHELMWTALDDIARMHPNSPAGKYAKETLKQIKNTYGR
jgi:hypothetical protein